MKSLTIDVETTGIPKKEYTYQVNYMDYPRILSVGYKIDDEESVEFIINQEGFIVPQEATLINEITQEMCDNSEHKLADVLRTILTIGNPDIIVGHNIYFDTSIIKANILRLIQEGKLEQEVFEKFEEFLHKDKRIDTMRKSITYCGLGRFPKLTEVYFKLFNETFNAHNAKDDVDATYRVYTELIRLGVITNEVKA